MSVLLAYRSSPTRLVAGVMSGTSLDAIDVAFVDITGTGAHLRHRLVCFHTVPIDHALRARLLDACAGALGMRETFELESDLGAMYAEAIMLGAARCGIAIERVRAVGLHGQTVYHAPRRAPHGVTVQLSGAAVVADRTGAIVVHDFRAADVAAGGEGAPLVPYCDYLSLRSPERNRVVLNVGGIANITWLPRDGTPDGVVAFDTGPGNMMIDAAMRALYGRDFDEGGATAASGHPSDALLAELLADEYFAWPPPKSAGRERFGEERGRRLALEARDAGMTSEDIIATLTMLTARTIVEAVRRFAACGAAVDEVLVSGGGARNTALMRMLSSGFPGAIVQESTQEGMPADAKEAICFAVLANEALMETPANLPRVTGARHPVVCGAIALPSDRRQSAHSNVPETP